jgi:predicted alpha/beta hydrolase
VGDRWGVSADLLYLHGFGQTRQAWARTAAHLAAAGFGGLAFDGRGHGESDWNAAEHAYSMEQFIADIDTVAAGQPSRPVLVGASMGGLLGLVTEGESASGRYSALVLVDITPRWEAQGVERILDFMGAHPEGFDDLDAAADAIMSYLPHRRRRKTPEELSSLLVRHADGRWRWHWDPRMLDEVARDGARYQQRLMQAARQVRIPTLLISGGLSELVSDATVAEFLQSGAARATRADRRCHPHGGRRPQRCLHGGNPGFPHRVAVAPRRFRNRPIRRYCSWSRAMTYLLPLLALLLAGAFAAYHRTSLMTWAILSVAALAGAVLLDANLIATAVALAVFAAGCGAAAAHRPAPPQAHRALAEDLHPHAAAALRHREHRAGSRHRRLRRRAVLGHAEVEGPADAAEAAADRGRAGLPRRPGGRSVRMTNDWDITHVRADLPPEIWEFLKRNKFFGMIIPKEYGGLGFSALAHSRVIQKLASISSVVSSTVGRAELAGPGRTADALRHRRAEEPLPAAPGRRPRDPCFALTGPFAGSDATSIPDYGIVCKGEWNGAKVLGVKLTFDKRYITLAPVATVIGLAFRMYDPDGCSATQSDIGITLALVPRDTPGPGGRPPPLPAQLHRSRTARCAARTCSCRCRS